MAIIKQDTFPEYIVAIIGGSFPTGPKGVYGLKEDDPVVLKILSRTPIAQIYTESGESACSNPFDYFFAGGVTPPNRIKIGMYNNVNVNANMMYFYLSPYFTIFNRGCAIAGAFGWSLIDGPVNPSYMKGNTGAAYYSFRDIFNFNSVHLFKTRSIKDVYEYFPAFEVNAETGGTATASNYAPSIGDSITVTSITNEGYEFLGWDLNGTIVSTETTYTFVLPYVGIYDTYRLCAVFSPFLNNLIIPSSECVAKNKILSQKISLNALQTISKVSLFLDLEKSDLTEYIEEEDGRISFSAANFQETTDEHNWKISYDSTDITSYNSAIDAVSANGFLINTNNTSYSTAEEVYSFSAKIKYNIFLSSGTYSFWSKSKGGGEFWYSWNDDKIPNKVVTTTDTSWQQIGTIDASDTEIYSLTVYTGSGNISLDQFYLSKIENGEDLSSSDYALPLSKCPFNTFVKIRENINSTDYSAWAWKPSNKINGSGWYNYDINSYSGEGLMLDFVVISGRPNSFVRWNYNTQGTESSTYISTDYGKTFVKD
jgi:hypothetical protein